MAISLIVYFMLQLRFAESDIKNITIYTNPTKITGEVLRGRGGVVENFYFLPNIFSIRVMLNSGNQETV